jgi:MFS family permease
MLFAYVFMDILAPIQALLEAAPHLRWTPDIYGTVSGSGYILNVMGFLILAGIILDKIGVRNSALVAGSLMLVGATIKFYGVSDAFNNEGFGFEAFNSFWPALPASAKMALLGFAIFGCGLEMAGITVVKAVVKWFKGKELALAMSLQIAIARLGVATVFILSPEFAKAGGIPASIGAGAVLLLIGFIAFCAYFMMDKKLDVQLSEAQEKDDPFQIKDIGKIFASSGFWIVALLCVLYYSAIFPFQKFAATMLDSNLTFVELSADSFWGTTKAKVIGYLVMLSVAITAFSSNFVKDRARALLLMCSATLLITYCYFCYMQQSASVLFSVFPLLAVGITPILGRYVDRKGKAATMLILGSILLIVCHLSFAFILPQFQGQALGGILVAFATILVLGASFSLVPASLWPSVPKLIDSNVLGSAYALIFWVQNIGLWLVPMLFGKILTASNTEIARQVADEILTPKEAAVMYNYTNPLIMMAGFGVAALIVGFILKAIDKKKGYGLELPNKKN